MSRINLVVNDKNRKKVISEVSKNEKNVFLEGMPGVGNIGKQAIDYIAKDKNALNIAEIFSSYFPHIVTIKKGIKLPHHNLYYFKENDIGFFLYTGNVQSKEDEGTYEFAKFILDLISDFEVDEIITIGGIGLKSFIEDPTIYLLGDKKLTKKYKTEDTSLKAESKINVILGLSGILLGHVDLLRKSKKDIDYKYMSVLIETFNSPLYPSYKESKNIIKFFDEKFNLDIDYSKLDKKIESFDKNDVLSKNLKQLDNVKKADQKDSWSSYIG
ncbi:MAG: PAC2 family protein [Candidatus Woesearchaeota archaeon]